MQTVTDSFVHGDCIVSNHTESEGVLGPDGLRIWHVTYVKTYMRKSIRGVGEVQLQYSCRNNDRVDFTGFELFSGGIGDSKGSMILNISGTVNSQSGLVTAQQKLLRGSGSAELYGYSGDGSYVITNDGYCSFEFTLLST